MPPLQLQKEPETGRKTVGIERGVDCIEYWLQAAERKSDQLRFELPRAEMEVIYLNYVHCSELGALNWRSMMDYYYGRDLANYAAAREAANVQKRYDGLEVEQ